MYLHEKIDLDEAMNAIKEQIVKDLSESVLSENKPKEHFSESLDLN